MTTQTHARSQLSAMKQCDHSLTVITFFLTKNFNYNKIFGTKDHFVFCFTKATIVSMLTSVSTPWTVSKKACFWKR